MVGTPDSNHRQINYHLQLEVEDPLTPWISIRDRRVSSSINGRRAHRAH